MLILFTLIINLQQCYSILSLWKSVFIYKAVEKQILNTLDNIVDSYGLCGKHLRYNSERGLFQDIYLLEEVILLLLQA